MKDTYKIYKTCTPSKMPVVVDVFDIIVVTMSCGGGIGGSRWDEYFYAEDITKLPTNSLATFTDAITKKKVTINTQYAVKVVEKQMLQVHSDNTAWRNYHERKCNSHCLERYIVLDRETKWECVDEYGKNEDETVKTITNEY